MQCHHATSRIIIHEPTSKVCLKDMRFGWCSFRMRLITATSVRSSCLARSLCLRMLVHRSMDDAAAVAWRRSSVRHQRRRGRARTERNAPVVLGGDDLERHLLARRLVHAEVDRGEGAPPQLRAQVVDLLHLGVVRRKAAMVVPAAAGRRRRGGCRRHETQRNRERRSVWIGVCVRLMSIGLGGVSIRSGVGCQQQRTGGGGITPPLDRSCTVQSCPGKGPPERLGLDKGGWPLPTKIPRRDHTAPCDPKGPRDRGLYSLPWAA